MSDSPFAFQDEEASEIGPADSQEGGSRRNVIMAGALAAVVLAAGAFFLLGGDDTSEEDFAIAPKPRVPQAQGPAPAPAPAADAVTLPEEGDPERTGHNPFKALILEPVAAPAAPAPSAPPPAPATMPIIVVTSDTGPSGTTTTVAASPAPAPAVSTVTFTAVSGSTPTGTFVLDGTSHTAAKGEVFGKKVEVVDLRKNAEGTWVALLRVGDGTPFDIYEDQEVVIP
jgi:hypothetical protein